MLNTLFRTAKIVAVMLLVAACSGCPFSTEQAMYDIGVKAMKGDSAFSQAAGSPTPAPREKCTFYIGKSAASVEIPYRVGNAGAATMEGVYIVWLYRIGTQWELDRSNAVPGQK